MFRAVVTSLALTLCARPATAQITTYIPPPRPDTVSAQAIAAADSAKRDSLARVSLTNMKAWVDSAAGVPLSLPERPMDTAVVVPEPPQPVTSFEDGMPAPATASDLPALALFGVIALAAGVALLAQRPRR